MYIEQKSYIGSSALKRTEIDSKKKQNNELTIWLTVGNSELGGKLLESGGSGAPTDEAETC